MSKTILNIALGIALVLSVLFSTPVYSASFDPNMIVSNETLYGIPSYLSSPALIQVYLKSKNSLLANYQVLVGFEPGSDIINPNYYKDLPYYLQPSKTTAPYNGKFMSVADLIWQLSTQDLGNSCSLQYTNICANNKVNTINPAFLLTMIQKESGMVYGSNSQLNPNDSNTQFILDRILGYYCIETSSPPTLQEKQRSCYDENPSWKYYKGFFRQMYYAVRFLRIHEQMCVDSRNFGPSHDNSYKVGKSKTYYDTLNGKPVSTTVTFNNGMTCAMYLYTPHVYNSQFNSFNILNGELRASENLTKYESEDSKKIDFKIGV